MKYKKTTFVTKKSKNGRNTKQKNRKRLKIDFSLFRRSLSMTRVENQNLTRILYCTACANAKWMLYPIFFCKSTRVGCLS